MLAWLFAGDGWRVGGDVPGPVGGLSWLEVDSVEWLDREDLRGLVDPEVGFFKRVVASDGQTGTLQTEGICRDEVRAFGNVLGENVHFGGVFLRDRSRREIRNSIAEAPQLLMYLP